MQYSGKKAILLLFINALHVHCRTVLKTQNMYETDSLPSLKAYEESECDCGSGGACSYVNGVSTCSCKSGFALNGQICEECNCGSDGTCSYVKGVKTCNCNVGFVENNGKCQECDCGSAGTCEYMKGVRTCNCLPGFAVNGQTCEECNCGSRGSCEYVEGVRTCNCLPGFAVKGQTCEACDCGPYGICSFMNGRKVCDCLEGFEKDDGKCKECDCGKDASCSFLGHTELCTCNAGYAVDYGQCKICDCGPNGDCSFINGQKVCNCPKGFEEDNGICTVKKDPCLDNPCKNGGTCKAEGNSFECSCPGYFSGYNCEKDPCSYNRCKNGGTCQVEGTSYDCYCPDEFSGSHCDIRNKECDCGIYGACHFEDGRKQCDCVRSTAELNGKCVECDCGLDGSECLFRENGTKKCYCGHKHIDVNGKCKECYCGPNGLCRIELGEKKCVCSPGFFERDGKCVAHSSTTVPTESTSLMTTILSSTATFCSCGENSKSCRYDALGEKECNCSYGYAQKNGHCEECNCGPYGSCSFEFDRKRCNCKSFAVEKNGLCVVMESTTLEDSTVIRTTSLPSTTQYCNCGEYSKSCRYDWTGYKICDCFPGYVENYGSCEECNCGPYGSCSFENGRKKCHCREFATEMNGVCVDKGTSPEGTTDSTTTYIISSTTVKDCDCGRLGICTFENGQKKCICDPLTSERNGKCVECDCGKNTKSCHFDEEGDRVCKCNSGYSQVFGICEECNCGVNARSCFFKHNGLKVCNCDFGYAETNGYCTAICNEEKCINGKCEIVGNNFKCRCDEGFTGHRCEKKIQTKSNKQDLWMILQFSGLFALFFLLSCMFCVWTRILNKISKK